MLNTTQGHYHIQIIPRFVFAQILMPNAVEYATHYIVKAKKSKIWDKHVQNMY